MKNKFLALLVGIGFVALIFVGGLIFRTYLLIFECGDCQPYRKR